jgi:hypothetical protein
MRVVISFAKDDADSAAQLEAALRRHNIQAWSSLDLAPGEDWSQVLDRESAGADGFIFLLGPDPYANPQLLTEWRLLFRNDWESKKALVPVVPRPHGTAAADVPPFLRNRKVFVTTNFDAIIDQLRHQIENPAEIVDPAYEQQARIERQKRLDEMRDYALALKEEAVRDRAKRQ